MTSIIKVDQIQTLAGAAPTAADLGINVSGSVLQVVSGTSNVWSPSASTSLVATPITASITPNSSSSKILISISVNGIYVASTSNYIVFKLYKNGSLLDGINDIVNQGSNSAPWGNTLAYNRLDSPATTNATTYTVYFRGAVSSTFGVNNYGLSGANTSTSTIILQEIAG